MKARSLLVGLSLLSTTVIADDFDNQIDFSYLTVDSADIIELTGTHHFETVKTANTAWAEAAFMGRNDNVLVSYANFDGDADGLALEGEFYSDSNFYGSIGLSYVDVDGADSDTAVFGEFGYFFDKNWLIAISGNDEDFSDTLGIRTKYVSELGDGQFFNIEADYSDFSENFTVSGDYYWTPQSSVGLTLSDADGYDFGLEFNHFFSGQFALGLEYTSTEGDDIYGFTVTGRF